MQSHANLGISFSSGSAVVPCPLQLVHGKTIKKPLGNHGPKPDDLIQGQKVKNLTVFNKGFK